MNYFAENYNIMHTVKYNNLLAPTIVINAIKNGILTPSAMAIILYSLSCIQPGYLISLDHVTVKNVLGIKRTSFFNAIKALKDLNLFVKSSKNTYTLNLDEIVPYSARTSS